LEKGRKSQEEGASAEDLLRLFRQQGASMLESVKLTRKLNSISLKEAQDLVLFSETWADHKENHERLQEAFAEALLGIDTDVQDDENLWHFVFLRGGKQGRLVRGEEITRRVLEIVIKRSALTPEQAKVIAEVAKKAQQAGLTIKVIGVP
jgi:hypothetical protein